MKSQYYFFLLIFLSVVIDLSANKPDSLLQLVEKEPTARNWNELCKYYSKTDPVDTTRLRKAAWKAYEMAVLENDLTELGRSFCYQGESFYYQGAIQSCLRKYQQALFTCIVTGQTDLTRDLLNDIGYCYNELERYDEAIAFFRQAIILSEQQANTEKNARTYLNIAFAYLRKGENDSTIVFNKKALTTAYLEKDTTVMIEADNQLGRLLRKKNEFQQALSYYEASLHLNQLSNNIRQIPTVLMNIAVLYIGWNKKEPAIEFAEKAVDYAIKTKDRKIIGRAKSILSNSLYFNKDYKTAIKLAKESLNDLESDPYYYNMSLGYIAAGYYELNELDSCNDYLNRMEELMERKHITPSIDYYYLKGTILCSKKEYNEAIVFLETILLQKDGFQRINPVIYNSLSYAYEKGPGDYEKALHYKKMAYALNDSIFQVEQNEALADFYARYRVAEKELENTQLKLNQERAVRIIISGIALIIIILLFVFFYLRNQRLKKEKEAILLARRMEEKENEYQNLLNETELRQVRRYLDGLEAERSRLAKELHDNVANELLSLEMKLGAENYSKDFLLQMHRLRTNVREISHELMPPVFHYATLPEIITDYVRLQNETNDVLFRFEVDPTEDWEDFPQQESLEFYRIVQEACGNTLKHAAAGCIDIFLQREDKRVELSISDNGKGMDMVYPEQKGYGLRIMKERAESIKAEFSLSSEWGMGTQIKVVLNRD